MSVSPSDFLGGFYGQYAGAKPSRAAKTATQSVKRGFVDPFTAAEEFAAKGAASGWRSGQIERGVRRIRRKPYGMEDLSRYTSYEPLVTGTYVDLMGRAATAEEIQKELEQARAARVSSADPGAFQAFLTDRLLSSQKGMASIKTPDDVEWERNYGPMARDAQGNLQRGLFRVNPAAVQSIMNSMIG